MFLWSDLQLPPLVFVLVALITILVLKNRRRLPGNIPPFPLRPYPLLGHAPMLTKDRAKKFRKWWKSTGDIYSLYLGSDLLVVINSGAATKEAFVKNADVFSDRPANYLTKQFPLARLGILHSSGANWKEQRTASISILRDFGMGKNFMDNKINEEISIYLQALSDLKGKPTDVQMPTFKSVSNILCAILIGNRFEYDDPYFTRLLELVDERATLLGNLPLMNTLPWLKYLPGDHFGFRQVITNMHEIKIHFGARFIKERTGEEGAIDCFINSYYQMMNTKKQAGVPTYLDDDNLLNIVLNLFVAGTETSSITLLWLILFALSFPEAQQKVYNEIVEVIGTERTPKGQDKQHMPYTVAYINEALRFTAIAPVSLPHLCSEDVNIGGYTIPKGTTVVANLDVILHDEEFWENPSAFRPERFLEGEGQGQTLPEEFIPFSVGRRYCMGASLAKTELFLFLTGILQRFEIRAEDPNNLPSLETRFSATTSPYPYKARLIERN